MPRLATRRDSILDFLKNRGSATLGQIAAHLDVSKQAALRHLESMESAGLATVASAEEHRRGRPESVYRLTPAAGEHFPDGHRELSAELVQFISAEQLKQFFERRAARLEAEYAPRLAGLDFEGRVRELAGSPPNTVTWPRWSRWPAAGLRSATATARSRTSPLARGSRA